MVTLADTSAWVEFLRNTDSHANERVRELLHTPDQLAVTEPVLMEVLAGAGSREERDSLRRMLRRCELVTVEPADYEAAAGLLRACRRHGETVRNVVDCLIAAVALRAGIALLHADADFDAIARTTPLQVA